jgi:hypothetical protein
MFYVQTLHADGTPSRLPSVFTSRDSADAYAAAQRSFLDGRYPGQYQVVVWETAQVFEESPL